MTGQILVPLRKDDPIEEIIPYLEEVARPGMRVVFLIPYLVKGSAVLVHDYMVATESWVQAAQPTEMINCKYSWDKQMGLAERKVALARKAMRKLGVEVAVDLYTQCLKRVVRNYTRNGDVHLVMERAGIGLQVLRFLQGTVGLFGLLKRPGIAPVLMLHPNH